MRTLLAILAALLFSMAAAGAADAAVTTVTFDDLPAVATGGQATLVTDQYADLGGPGQGVVFGPLPGSGQASVAPEIANVPGQAHSGNQVANIGCPRCRIIQASTPGTYPDATGSFQVPRSTLSVDVGLLGAAAPTCTDGSTAQTCAEVELLAFDANGHQVASAGPVTVTQGAGVNTPLSVTTQTASISGFEVVTPRQDTDSAKDVAIDDLTFNTPTAPPPPFSVRIGGSTNVGLGSCTATVPVIVTRAASFPGPVSLSVTGIPGGIAAAFTPSQATFPGNTLQQTVELTLTAPRTGQTFLRRTATVHASATGQSEQIATFNVGGTCPLLFDPEVISMQITQGTQLPELPQRISGNPNAPIPYASIGGLAKPGSLEALALLAFNKPTFVRVYADLKYGPASGLAVPAVLRGFRYDSAGHLQELPGSPITPVASPGLLFPGLAGSGLSFQDSYAGTYTFALPSNWERGRIELEAALLPSQASQSRPVAIAANATAPAVDATAANLPGQPIYAPCTTDECIADNHFTISQIPFRYTFGVTIRPLAMIQTHPYDATLPDPDSTFSWARVVTPVPLTIEPYATTIDIGDQLGKDNSHLQVTNELLDRVRSYVCSNGEPSHGWDVGIEHDGIRSAKASGNCWQDLGTSTHDFAYVNAPQPLSSVAHELFHLFGRKHASPACGGQASGGSETWPPDQVGNLQSVGLAPAPVGFTLGPYKVLPGDSATSPWFDFMSYCGFVQAGDPLGPNQNEWVSVHNWNAIMASFSYGPAGDRAAARHRTRAAARPIASLHVSASIDSAGHVAIQAVDPVSTPPWHPTTSGVPYQLVAKDAGGRVLSRVQMIGSSSHVDGRPPGFVVILDGVVPAAGVASLSIVNGATTLASRSKNHAPTVSIRTAPAFGPQQATIRWSAADADQDPLAVEVDYSGDNGRTWRPVWLGPDLGQTSLPESYMFRTGHARLRVSVSDGFTTTTALSPQFSAPGAAPFVRIVAPPAGVRQPNDAPLVLSGQAFDDQLRQLSGRALRWMLGAKLLGTGKEIAAAGLPAGRDTIELLARDRFGRVGRASIVVQLKGSKPLFLKLAAPRHVGRHARSLTLTVAVSIDSTLAVTAGSQRAQRFAVDRTPRRVSIKIKPGNTPITLKLSLRAGNLVRSGLIVVSRT